MLKKFVLFTCLFPFLSLAQQSMKQFYDLNALVYNYDYFDESFITTKLRKKLQIKSIERISTDNSKRHKTDTTFYTFNRFGKNTSFYSKEYSFEKQYLNDTLLTYVLTHKKNNTFETKSTYSGGLLSTKLIFENGKLVSTYILTYTDDNQISSSVLKRKHAIYEIQNTYSEERKLIKTVYLVNAKIKKLWIYECRPEGQLVAAKNEALSSFCTYREESSDGSFTTFTRTLKDGKPYLNKLVFTKDSVLVLSQKYLNDSLLIWERSVLNQVETTTSYKKSGKLIYIQNRTFDQHGNMLSQEFRNKKKGPFYSKRNLELNSQGAVQQELVYRRGKLRKTIQYRYTYF